MTPPLTLLFKVTSEKSLESLAVSGLITTNPVFMRYFKVLHKNMHKKFFSYEGKRRCFFLISGFDMFRERCHT